MCKCTPNIRTPYCGKPGCKWPKQKTQSSMNAYDAAMHGGDWPKLEPEFNGYEFSKEVKDVVLSRPNINEIYGKGLKLDPVVEAVRADLHKRSQLGVNKYGTTLADNKGDLRYWLNHAYEECLDQANYLKRAIMEIDSNGTK